MIVVWRVTERCNLACGFCAYDRGQPGPRRSADAAQVARFGRVLGDYRRLTGARVLISWLGGEPMLWPALFAVSRTLREVGDVELGVTTNGTTLHRFDVRENVLAWFSELTLSVDGLADFHDRVRGWSGGWRQLRAAVQALAQARSAASAKLKLRTNVVLMQDNLEQFPALCRALVDWGIDEITFNQLGGRDRPQFYPAHRLRLEDVTRLRAMLPELQSQLAASGVRLCGNERYLDRFEASAANRALAVGACSPGEQFLFVDERQRVAPCSFASCSHGVALESIENAADLLALPQTYARLMASRPPQACADCHSTRVFEKFEA